MIAIGNTEISAAYVGSSKVSRVYCGSNLVYEDYIPWLESLGCICYLPLSAEGDLQDRISGESLQLTGKGSMTWDSSEGMYKITTPASGVNDYVALLNNGMNANTFSNNCFTTLTTFKGITKGGYYLVCQLSPVSTTVDTKISMNPLYNAASNTSNLPSTTLRLATYVGEDARILYQEGQLYGTYDTSAGYLPSNWVTTGNGLQLGTLRTSSTNYYNKQFYIKDIYIFNTKLTLAQIREIQGFN